MESEHQAKSTMEMHLSERKITYYVLTLTAIPLYTP